MPSDPTPEIEAKLAALAGPSLQSIWQREHLIGVLRDAYTLGKVSVSGDRDACSHGPDPKSCVKGSCGERDGEAWKHRNHPSCFEGCDTLQPETCVCPHPHGECVTCGCRLLGIPRGELLPCPFCGGEAVYGYAPDGGVWVRCQGCGAETEMVYAPEYGAYVDAGEEIACQKWNRRCR